LSNLDQTAVKYNIKNNQEKKGKEDYSVNMNPALTGLKKYVMNMMMKTKF